MSKCKGEANPLLVPKLSLARLLCSLVANSHRQSKKSRDILLPAGLITAFAASYITSDDYQPA